MNYLTNLQGNLTRDPEPKYTNSGTGFVVFDIAQNKSKMVNGQWEDNGTNFWSCVAWGDVSESLLDIRKGDRVNIEGSIDKQYWTDKEGGKREKTIINVKRIEKFQRR